MKTIIKRASFLSFFLSFFLFFDPQCETSLWIGFSDVTDPAKGISLSFSPSKREKGGEGIKEDEVKTGEK